MLCQKLQRKDRPLFLLSFSSLCTPKTVFVFWVWVHLEQKESNNLLAANPYTYSIFVCPGNQVTVYTLEPIQTQTEAPFLINALLKGREKRNL